MEHFHLILWIITPKHICFRIWNVYLPDFPSGNLSGDCSHLKEGLWNKLKWGCHDGPPLPSLSLFSATAVCFTEIPLGTWPLGSCSPPSSWVQMAQGTHGQRWSNSPLCRTWVGERTHCQWHTFLIFQMPNVQNIKVPHVVAHQNKTGRVPFMSSHSGNDITP